MQVLTAVTLRDFWLDDVLPFSCCPMFMLPRNIYDEVRVSARLGLGLGLANPSPNRNPNPKQWPKWWTMCDSPLNGTLTRNSGAMGPLKPWPRP